MSYRHSADPIPSRSGYWGEETDAGMLARRPRNDPEIVSAHARDGELRPGCHSNSSKHTGFEDNQRSGDRCGGAQHDPIPVRVTPRRSVDRPHPSMSENTLHYADLDGRDVTGFWHDAVESELLYVRDDTECPGPSVSSTCYTDLQNVKSRFDITKVALCNK